MKNNRKAFPPVSCYLLLLFQITIGLLSLILSGKISQFSWLMNILVLWLGVTVGMYLGEVPFFFQKSFPAHNKLLRFATTALGALIPLLGMLLAGVWLGIQHVIYLTLAPIFALLALSLSLLGFFLPSRLATKPTAA